MSVTEKSDAASGKKRCKPWQKNLIFALVVLAAAAVLRRVLAPRLTAAKGEALAVTLCGWYAFAGAVLLFQHYFVGPVYTIYK